MFISISTHTLHISKPSKKWLRRKLWLNCCEGKVNPNTETLLQNNATGWTNHHHLPVLACWFWQKNNWFLLRDIKIVKSFFCCKFCCPNSTQSLRQFQLMCWSCQFFIWKIKPCIYLFYLFKNVFNWNRIVSLPLFLCLSSPSLLPSFKFLSPTPKLISSFSWIILG